MPPLRLSTLQHTLELFWPAFERRAGAVLLAGTQAPEPSATFGSLTEYERFYSHLHLLDEVRHAIPTEYDAEWDSDRLVADHPEHAATWALALTVGQMWAAKLHRDFPAHAFRVYVTRVDDPIIHFHAVHPGEAPWIADADAAPAVERGDLALYRVGATENVVSKRDDG